MDLSTLAGDPTLALLGLNTAALPLVLGLVQLLKPLVPNRRLWPLLALGMALAVNVLYGLATADAVTGRAIATSLLAGLLTGLAAAGAYAGGRTLAEGPDIPGPSTP